MAPAAATARRSALALLRLMLAVALGALFLGALFMGPARDTGVATRLRGHAERARLIATDDAARADAYEYVSGQWSLLSIVMLDIRCVRCIALFTWPFCTRAGCTKLLL
jgi:hypothetical protein